MTIQEAEKVSLLYRKLSHLSQKVAHLHELINAKLTGTNPDTPGGANYMQSVVKDHWSIFKDTFKDYFVAQLSKAIEEAENDFSEAESQLQSIQISESKVKCIDCEFHHDPVLSKRIEDCNLSVKVRNVCEHNGIETLEDLTKMTKTDFYKFNNVGMFTLGEIDDLLKEHGLTWAKWESV